MVEKVFKLVKVFFLPYVFSVAAFVMKKVEKES